MLGRSRAGAMMSVPPAGCQAGLPVAKGANTAARGRARDGCGWRPSSCCSPACHLLAALQPDGCSWRVDAFSPFSGRAGVRQRACKCCRCRLSGTDRAGWTTRLPRRLYGAAQAYRGLHLRLPRCRGAGATGGGWAAHTCFRGVRRPSCWWRVRRRSGARRRRRRAHAGRARRASTRWVVGLWYE